MERASAARHELVRRFGLPLAGILRGNAVPLAEIEQRALALVEEAVGQGDVDLFSDRLWQLIKAHDPRGERDAHARLFFCVQFLHDLAPRHQAILEAFHSHADGEALLVQFGPVKEDFELRLRAARDALRARLHHIDDARLLARTDGYWSHMIADSRLGASHG